MRYIVKVAILDFDNTLVEGYSRYELAYEMEAIGMIKKGLRSELEDLMIEYADGRITYNEKQADDKKLFSKYYKGVDNLELRQFLHEEFDLEGRMYEFTKPLLKKLNEEDYLTIVISGGWDFILEAAQEILEFDTFFATSFEIHDGLLTGKYTKITDENDKRLVAKQVLTESQNSIGLGDSTADIEFLSRVKKGFLFEPNSDAIEMAKEFKNIETVNRKNVLEEILKSL